ncbi:MAG: class I SAM-dependent methyltransferase [Candidatus Dormiibacterota bacterium]
MTTTADARPANAPGLKLDVGCGELKREGFVGVDILDVADYRCDIANDPLPFEDNSVSHIFSSHCLEHIPPAQMGHVFREFTRVAHDEALLELWHPFSMHRDAFIWDHKTFLNEEHYYHIAYRYPSHWEPLIGGRWILEEVRYNLEPPVLADLMARGVDLEFAVNYLHSVVRELGVSIRVRKTPVQDPVPLFRRTIYAGPRDHPFRVLGRGPYSPSPGVQFPALTIKQASRALGRAVARRLPAVPGRRP